MMMLSLRFIYMCIYIFREREKEKEKEEEKYENIRCQNQFFKKNYNIILISLPSLPPSPLAPPSPLPSPPLPPLPSPPFPPLPSPLLPSITLRKIIGTIYRRLLRGLLMVFFLIWEGVVKNQIILFLWLLWHIL